MTETTTNPKAKPLTPEQAMQVDDVTFLDFAQRSAIDGQEQVAKSRRAIAESVKMLGKPKAKPVGKKAAPDDGLTQS